MVLWTVLSTLGGLGVLLFTFHRLGIKPQIENQQEFFKKKFEHLEQDIQSVKDAVDSNTETLSKHGERISSLETQIRMTNGNPDSGKED